MFVPFGAFAPDRPVLGSDALVIAQNCIPLTDKSYGPFRNIAAQTGALTARCQGAISVRAADGTIHVFAGDATKLYKLNSDGVTWDDVSRAAGYTTSADQRWYFVQMGNRIVATNYTDEIQTYIIGTSAVFANLAAAAPKARFIAVIKGFLVAADTWDASDGYNQNRVWWADHDDPTNWPTPGTAAAAAAQSDFQDIQFGGGINGLVGGCGGRDGVVFLQNAIVVMDYVGGGVVFAFADAERGRGTNIPNSIINIGPFAGYIGEDGFYLFNGASSVPIGMGKVDRFFWDGDASETITAGVDPTQLVRVSTSYDAKQNLVYWGYSAPNQSGTVTNLLVYNWMTGWWTWCESNVEFIVNAYSPGYTLESLDSVSASIDDLPYSLDSPAWMGGRPSLAGFNTQHQFGYFDGTVRAATFQTGQFHNQTGRRYFIRGVRPVYDGPHDSSVSTSLLYSDSQNIAPGVGSTSTSTNPGADGVCPQRVSARYARVNMRIESGTTWQHARGVEVDMREEGLR